VAEASDLGTAVEHLYRLGAGIDVCDEQPGGVGSDVHDGDAHGGDPKGGDGCEVCSRWMTWVRCV
jgi:hypothetical protein